MTLYLVTGTTSYREHEPGQTFEASLPPDVEARALKRGAIEILERSTPRIQPSRWRPPDGWTKANDAAPQRGRFREGSVSK